jgi:hypothetical protein
MRRTPLAYVENVRGVVPGEWLTDARPPRSRSLDEGRPGLSTGAIGHPKRDRRLRRVPDNAPHEDGDMCKLANRTADAQALRRSRESV